jgi:hypothetical protein
MFDFCLRAAGQCNRLTGASMAIIIRAVAYVARRGVTAMIKNLVAGCVVAALIFMGLLAYAQKHHRCWNGQLIMRGHFIKQIKGLRSCGSVSPSM